MPAPAIAERYRPITAHSLRRHPVWSRLDDELRESIDVVSRVLPFRTNDYVVSRLIDWDRVPADPLYQLTFAQREMLDPVDYARVRDLVRAGAPDADIHRAADEIRRRMNPHPGGQTDANVPSFGGEPVRGVQHKYRETVLFFPARGQTCHAYCTYCFRWAQFVDLPDLRFAARTLDPLVAYLRAHPEVSDVLITGGDPLVMSTKALRSIIEPLLAPELGHVRNLRIGTKALAYWPQRVLTDPDADDLARLFEEVVAADRHLAIMGHLSHPVELSTPEARAAVSRVRSTGAEIRAQAPIVRHVNDDPRTWAELWTSAVGLGIVPYYCFIERDTGPKRYFELPLARAFTIFRDAYRQVSGLARSVRGPSMSAHPGKVRILGVEEIAGERVFVLDFLQARDPSWVGRPFLARFDAAATWFDQLRPALGERHFFFQSELSARTPASDLPAGLTVCRVRHRLWPDQKCVIRGRGPR